MRNDRWEGSDEVLRPRDESAAPRDRAAAAWAAAFVADGVTVVKAMGDADRLVRLEGIRAFARMKGEVPAVAGVLIECMRDGEVEGRREALRQALRWAPPADWQQPYAEALAAGLASPGRDVRRLAAEGVAPPAPPGPALTPPPP